ncbi:MAG: 50S ribosomal protein L11 methyltransferase [Vicinamibacterales bacterium]
MSSHIDEHRRYVTDEDRVAAFDRAIAESVHPGDVVVDLGSGTGILGLLACRAGARRVYSIEQTGMIEVARAICAANGFSDRVVFLNACSSDVDLPELADVVVADQIGYFGYDAGIVRCFADARDRFLKPGGTLIPGRIDLCVAAVEGPHLMAPVASWERRSAGFDMRAARAWAVNTSYARVLSRDQLLTDPGAPFSVDLSAPVPSVFTFATQSVARRSGTLHGVAGWFSASLSATVTLSNLPGAGHTVDRCHVFFPIDRPIEVKPGDEIRIGMYIIHDQMLVNWIVEVNGERFEHSTFKGLIVSREELRRMKHDHVPRLTPLGRVRRDVLALCDGERPVKAITGDVWCRHPGLFRSPDDADAFVARVLAENGE